jgi:hypothetical protein
MTGAVDIQDLRERLSRNVASQLWAVYHDDPQSPFLIWPLTRGFATRVSEQESKILITQWLQQHGHHYSVETPTTEAYQQSGTYELSARIDVTVYTSRDAALRALNIELKAGTSSDKNFSKDFEKLIREGVPGLWFHTLTTTGPSTWRTIEDRICRAFEAVLEHSLGRTHTVYFAFCVLEQRQLIEFTLDFAQDWHAELRTSIREATGHSSPARSPSRKAPRSVSDVDEANLGASLHSPSDRRLGSGSTKQLVLLPSLEPATVMHLSTRGASYKLRYFDESHPSAPWKVPGCETLEDLLRVHPLAHTIDIVLDARSVTDTDYWMERVRVLNEQLGL